MIRDVFLGGLVLIFAVGCGAKSAGTANNRALSGFNGGPACASLPPSCPSLPNAQEAPPMGFQPSDREERARWLINRMRRQPALEYPLLIHSGDANVQAELSFMQVDETVLAKQWSLLEPAAPLAWSSGLQSVALAHNDLMAQFDSQTHQLPGEPAFNQRMQAAGFNGVIGENVYGYVYTPFFAHAAFAIDWGYTSTGIQDGTPHRDNVMNVGFDVLGLSVIDARAGEVMGPMLITEDFSSAPASDSPALLGVAFRDGNGSGEYQQGQGLGGISVLATSGTQTLVTATGSSGGFQLSLPPGSYSVTFCGGSLTSPVSTQVTMGAENVELDLLSGAASVTVRR